MALADYSKQILAELQDMNRLLVRLVEKAYPVYPTPEELFGWRPDGKDCD